MFDNQLDDAVFDALSARLQERVPESLMQDPDCFVAAIRGLPPGLRAMAATYQLDVSITLDDLGWHFANWHHRELAGETLLGLRELEATEEADLFEKALELVQPFWEQIGALIADDFQSFVDWYDGSELEQALDPLNDRLYALHRKRGQPGLFYYWVQYARKYPHRIDSILH